MHLDSVQELDFLALAPRGEMAVVADTDDVADDQLPDSIPVPRSMPIIPHVRVVTGRGTFGRKRDRMPEDEAAPPSV